MENMLSRERRIRSKDHFASSTTELGIEEFEKSRMPEQQPAQTNSNKPNDRLPLAALEAIGQQQGYATIQHRQDGMTGGLYFSLRGVGQIDPKANGKVLGEKSIICRRIDAAVDGGQ